MTLSSLHWVVNWPVFTINVANSALSVVMLTRLDSDITTALRGSYEVRARLVYEVRARIYNCRKCLPTGVLDSRVQSADAITITH